MTKSMVIENQNKDTKVSCERNENSSDDHPRMAELKEKVMAYIKENDGVFHPDDVELLKTNNLWINRFLNFLDQPFEKAFSHLVETFKHRKEKGIHSFEKSIFPIECWLSSTAFIYLPDREGRPVLYIRVKNHFKGDAQVMEMFRKFVILLIDQIDRLSNKEMGYNIFLDLYGMGLKNLDLEMLSFLVDISRFKYPNGNKYCFVHGLPWYLNLIIKNIVAALPSDTSKKVKFINGVHHKEISLDEVTSNFSPSTDLNNNSYEMKSNEVEDRKKGKLEIEEYIDLDNLPSFLGGRATLNERIMPHGTHLNINDVGSQYFGFSQSKIETLCKPFKNVINEAQLSLQTFRKRNLVFEFDLENSTSEIAKYFRLS